MKTVAIIEGFAGGPLHTSSFRKSLRESGFSVIKNRRQADIIVAHSAGIYGIPTDARAGLLMLIGPTYWPGERLLKRVLRHTRSSHLYFVGNVGWRGYVWKKLLEIYYAFRRLRYLWLGVKHNNRLGHLEKLTIPERQVILIRNEDDPFTTPDIEAFAKTYKNVRYVKLPGIHEDYTVNNQPYIKLLLEATK